MTSCRRHPVKRTGVRDIKKRKESWFSRPATATRHLEVAAYDQDKREEAEKLRAIASHEAEKQKAIASVSR